MLKIGFHTGSGGNATGIGDNYWSKLDTAGIPCFQMSVDSYGQCLEVIELRRSSGVPHVVAYRMTTAGQGDGFNYDVPQYLLDPIDAANIQWQAIVSKLPPEYRDDPFHKEHVWLVVCNEVDKNRADWLGQFGVRIGELAIEQGYNVALFGFSSGEPEPEHWEEPGMLAFLELCGQFPDRVALALHEYSYSWDIWNPRDAEGQPTFSLIGRYADVLEVCVDHNIPAPTILITEWGWHQDKVPSPEDAIPDITNVGLLYEKELSVRGAMIWYLGPWHTDIDDQTQRLIEPVGNLALNWIEGSPMPPSGQHKAIVVKAPQEVEKSEWLNISDYSFSFRHTMTASHDDMLSLMNSGNEESYVKVFEPDRPSQQESIAFLEAAGFRWEPHHLSGPPPDQFKFEAWPTDYKVITQPFGVHPNYYGQFGLPGHEGVDIKAPLNSPIRSVAAGTVYEVKPDDGHAYGVRVRIRHNFGYRSIYAHMVADSTTVQVGEFVSANRLLGLADNTGNIFSGSSHVHLALKNDDAYVGGPKYIGYPHQLVDPTPFLLPLMGDSGSGASYDLLPYMKTADAFGTLYEVQTEGGPQQRHQTQVQSPVFYHTKDREWEQLMYDTGFIYRFTDSSPGPQGGRPRYYQLRDGGSAWSKWCPRYMELGEIYERGPTVSFYWKDTCEQISNDLAPSLIKLEAVYNTMTFFTGITIKDVMVLSWMHMDQTEVERYFYAQRFGLVGWEGAGKRSAISEIHAPGARPNNARETISCINAA